MKVILNKDLSTLGEEGDVKDVARGYARNYLFPRGIALPFTPKTEKLFEARKEEIETRKAQKRQDSQGLKERLESLELSVTMPAGANGKLYGAVTSQTLADELAKQGFQIERKRIELAGNSFKSVGKYKAVVKLYENSSAEIQITILGQALKTETPHAPVRPNRRRRDEARGEAGTPVDSAAGAVEAAEPASSADSAGAGPAEAAEPDAALKSGAGESVPGSVTGNDGEAPPDSAPSE
ncbi:MAG: 50S ribosomal protein L9 [Treponema sp.]|jgi:large subunit ribosomal protein L9|nr:50S ribosomal protein L9 [Treponema sp.]